MDGPNHARPSKAEIFFFYFRLAATGFYVCQIIAGIKTDQSVLGVKLSMSSSH